MKTLSEQHWEAIEFEGDLRWELVQRVIESPHLIGSARLRDFLLHVTACAIRETPEDATEQQIGIQVFQRSPGFNSSEDSIVRSQARLLRLKLSAYFNAEGASEPLIIEIPKGHYLPVFSPSQRANFASEKQAEVRTINARIKSLAENVEALDERFRTLLAGIPNVPHESVPTGKSADDNVEVRCWGQPPVFEFEPKAHWDLGAASSWLLS